MAPSKEINDKPIKIDKWDSSALKNTLDDGAKKVLVDINGYKESHILMDGRLLICTVAIGFALFALVWDFLYPFPQSRNILLTCSISYFILMGVLTLYLTYIEKGVFLVALEKDRAMMEPDNEYRLTSSLRKYDDTYHLTILYVNGKTKERRCANLSKRVDKYFDENGLFCFDLFKPDIDTLKNELSSESKKRN